MKHIQYITYFSLILGFCLLAQRGIAQGLLPLRISFSYSIAVDKQPVLRSEVLRLVYQEPTIREASLVKGNFGEGIRLDISSGHRISKSFNIRYRLDWLQGTPHTSTSIFRRVGPGAHIDAQTNEQITSRGLGLYIGPEFHKQLTGQMRFRLQGTGGLYFPIMTYEREDLFRGQIMSEGLRITYRSRQLAIPAWNFSAEVEMPVRRQIHLIFGLVYHNAFLNKSWMKTGNDDAASEDIDHYLQELRARKTLLFSALGIRVGMLFPHGSN